MISYAIFPCKGVIVWGKMGHFGFDQKKMVDPGNFKNCTKNVLKVSRRKKGKIFMKIILLVFKKNSLILVLSKWTKF